MTMFNSYSTLVQRIKDVTEDDSLEFSNYIPTAIGLAEERLLKELDFPELETQETGTLSTGSAFVLKPSNRHVIRNFFITDNNNKRKQIQKRKIDYCYDYWPNVSETETPKYYADYSDAQYYIAPTPDDTYDYELRYVRIPTPLTPSNSSNYFLQQQCRNALFHACMVEATRYLQAWSEVDRWESAYQVSASDWNYHAMRQRRDGSTVPDNNDGNYNSLRHTVTEGTKA